ncbi:hypothetical protein [Lysinibacillus sp. K60]|uniref:hypothetical protein n=1 Tax=Lysinibacillus sp. K60 TaxID=2720027 RepID=UPI001C8C2242|nr:hypothetical protein [Lysinibacillus sp. K60]MBX8945880.1 hypothetical protein [Lysinibacillus sp. K60]
MFLTILSLFVSIGFVYLAQQELVKQSQANNKKVMLLSLNGTLFALGTVVSSIKHIMT